jgi:hypothetical protein
MKYPFVDVGEPNDFGFRSFMNTAVLGAFRHHNDFGGPALVQAIASSWWPAHGLPHGPVGVHKADCPFGTEGTPSEATKAHPAQGRKTP